MYDSYSEYYGLNDVEVKEIPTIGGGNSESYCPKKYYTINFQPEQMTLQQERLLYSYVTRLKQQVSRHIKCLQTFEPTEEIEFALSECFDILDAEIVSLEHYEFINWYFNHGQLRSEDEMNNHILELLQARRKVEDEKINQVTGGISTFFFAIFMFFMVFIFPGLFSAALSNDNMTMHTIVVNCLLATVAGPIQIGIWTISIAIFASVKGVKNGPTVKGAVATTAISTAMHARNMSNLKKDLFSEKKI